jgi:hypothetical protein
VAVTADIAHRIPAGWYPVRDDRSRRRWWNGAEWTEYYSANPEHRPDGGHPHTLRGAVTFKDRIAASTLAALLLANVIVLAFVAKLI